MAYKKNSFKAVLGYNRKTIAYFQNRIKKQTQLLNTIKSVLPSHLSNHAHYCVMTEKKISLYTDSAIWASQLRFHQQAILESVLKANQGNFKKIQIKIIQKTTELTPEKSLKLPSEKNVFLIFDQAENQADEKLKNALFNLGNTLKKKIRNQYDNN